MKILSEYLYLNLWLAAVSIVFFAYDGTVTVAEGSILLFLDVICIIHLPKFTHYLFGIKK